MSGLFEVLASTDDQEQKALIDRRTTTAAQERASKRLATFIRLGECKCEECAEDRKNDREPRHSNVQERVALVDDTIRVIAEEVAEEYGGDVERAYFAATAILGGGHKDGCDCGFCKNKGKGFGNSDESDDSDDDSDEDNEKEASVKTACCGCGHDDCKDCGPDCGCGGKKTAAWDENGPVLDTRADAPVVPGQRGNSELPQETSNCLDCGGQMIPLGDGTFQCTNCGVVDDGQRGPYNDVRPEEFQYPRQGDPGWETYMSASVKEASMFDFIAADVEDGDSYQQETVSLPSNDDDGLDGPSPEIDKGNSGDHEGWSLDPIDVNSVRHPLEKQDIDNWTAVEEDGQIKLENSDLTSDDFLGHEGPTHSHQDADKSVSPPDTDRTKTWTGTEGLAEPVTSATRDKWTLVE